MKYLKFGKELELSQVVVGCMRVKDAGMDGKELLQFAEICMDMGITAFDHAPVYGGYTCEQLFGEAVLKNNPGLRKKMKLITKSGIVLPGVEQNKSIYYKSTKANIIKEVNESLLKLNSDYIDLLLIHRPDPLAHPGETAAALEQVVREGKVLNVGVSNFTSSQVEMLQSYLSIPLVTNQIELSVKTAEHFFDGAVDAAFTKRMPLMSWSPLGGGSIFSGQEEQSVRLREILQQIAEEHGTSMDAIMYAWLFIHPVGIAAITGTMNPDRIKTAVEALTISLTYDEWYLILAASRGYQVP